MRAPAIGLRRPGAVPARPPQGRWSVVEIQVGLLALMEGVGVGVISQVGCLDQSVGQRPERTGAAAERVTPIQTRASVPRAPSGWPC
jgi:hypothetical protein